MQLYEVSNDRNNNLNIIRFIAAIMVIYAHAYALSIAEKDPLSNVVRGQISFGSLAVSIFFFFSGFLICCSVMKNRSLYKFFKGRIIRIFPPLIAVVFFCVFILGSFVTELTISDYLTNKQTYLYLTNIIFILRHNLPGVFESNIYGRVVNGSLWTLPVEFFCYVVCIVMYKMGILEEKKMKYTLPFWGLLFIASYVSFKEYPLFQSVLVPCSMFYMGMLYCIYRQYIHLFLSVAILCVIGIILSALIGIMRISNLLFLPYLLSYLAFGTKLKMSNFGKKYEISYGVYLCAFPIQQLIVMLNGGSMSPLLNFCWTVPFAIVFGFLLNISIERPLRKFC